MISFQSDLNWHISNIIEMYWFIDTIVRDRPFNLKGGLWFFVLFRIFFSDNTRVRIKKNCRTKCKFFFQNLALGYMTKTLNQIKKKIPPPKSEYFFQQHWESEYFFRKTTKKIALCATKKKYSNSCVVRNKYSERNKKPFKLNGRSLIKYGFIMG